MFKEHDEINRCCWIEEDGSRCEQHAIARIQDRFSTCNTHSYKLIGKGYFDEANHYHKTEASPYLP